MDVLSIEIDHLIPAKLALFEESAAFDEFQKRRNDFGINEVSADKTRIIQILTLPSDVQADSTLLSLAQLGDVYGKPENQRFRLEVRRLSSAGLKSSDLEIDSKLAKRLFAIWSKVTRESRYPSSRKSLSSSGQYHSCFVLGEGTAGGWFPASIPNQGIMFSLSEFATYATIWVESEGKNVEMDKRVQREVLRLEKLIK